MSDDAPQPIDLNIVEIPVKIWMASVSFNPRQMERLFKQTWVQSLRNMSQSPDTTRIARAAMRLTRYLFHRSIKEQGLTVIEPPTHATYLDAMFNVYRVSCQARTVYHPLVDLGSYRLVQSPNLAYVKIVEPLDPNT